jgi:uncharacterized membrane protein HdeD (DUF308 family)
MVAKVFLCYRRDDSAAFAGRVQDRLVQEFGRDLLFMDVDAIPLGANFATVLRDAVAKCEVLLAVIGPHWLDARDDAGVRRLDDPNDYVRIEIGAALQRNVPVVPLLLDGAKVPKANQLPVDLKELAMRNGLDVRHGSFHSDLDKLVRDLKGQWGQDRGGGSSGTRMDAAERPNLNGSVSSRSVVAPSLPRDEFGVTQHGSPLPHRVPATPGSIRPEDGLLSYPILDALARRWWLLLLRAIVTVVFGIMIFLWPGLTLSTLTLLYGAVAVVDGAILVIAGGSATHTGTFRPMISIWGLAVEGLLGIALGIFAIGTPGMTAALLTVIISTWALVRAISNLIGVPIKLRKETDDDLTVILLLLIGVLSLGFGFFLLFRLAGGISDLILPTAIYSIVSGSMSIALTLRLKIRPCGRIT